MLDYENQERIVQAFCNVAEIQTRAATEAQCTQNELQRPFMMLRPRLYPDGNQWCALYGENIQEGVCGFGDTPEKASYDFDKNWYDQDLTKVANDKAAWLKEQLAKPNNGLS